MLTIYLVLFNVLFFSHFLLTANNMVVLREAPDRAGWGRVKHTEPLLSILKITAKKDRNIIIFRFGKLEDEEAVVNKVIRLRIPNSHKATEAVQQQIAKLNP